MLIIRPDLSGIESSFIQAGRLLLGISFLAAFFLGALFLNTLFLDILFLDTLFLDRLFLDTVVRLERFQLGVRHHQPLAAFVQEIDLHAGLFTCSFIIHNYTFPEF